jgi:hypothetical protein
MGSERTGVAQGSHSKAWDGTGMHLVPMTHGVMGYGWTGKGKVSLKAKCSTTGMIY